MSLAENLKKAHSERKLGRSRLVVGALLTTAVLGASGCDTPHEREMTKNLLVPPHEDYSKDPGLAPQGGGGGGAGGGGTY